MKICFFGSYERSKYNMLLKKILEKQDIDVIECHEEITGVASFVTGCLKLWKKHRTLQYDILFIPWRGITTLPLAKLISKKPLVYIAFISIYDTLINDRKKFKPNSIIARILHTIERLACKWSHMIITESFASGDYFVSEFGITKEKFRRSLLCADEEKFPAQPLKKPSEIFNVLFFGTFIPLHGIDVIIESAKILSKYSDIHFWLCGDGQQKEEMVKLSNSYNLKNVEFLGFVAHNILLEKIRESDVCLGIFDNGNKSQIVVTNKVYQILSSNRPLITIKSPATIEVGLKNKENCILVEPKNAADLADSILLLKQNHSLLKNIANSGHTYFKRNMSMEKVGYQLNQDLLELQTRNKSNIFQK